MKASYDGVRKGAAALASISASTLGKKCKKAVRLYLIWAGATAGPTKAVAGEETLRIKTHPQPGQSLRRRLVRRFCDWKRAARLWPWVVAFKSFVNNSTRTCKNWSAPLS